MIHIDIVMPSSNFHLKKPYERNIKIISNYVIDINQITEKQNIHENSMNEIELLKDTNAEFRLEQPKQCQICHLIHVLYHMLSMYP